MAWNEPGDSKDPWGNKNQEGPPDLDEVFKNVQSKVQDIFGRDNKGGASKGGSGGGSSGIVGSGGPSGFAIAVVLCLLLAIWALTGIYIIQPAERGVVTQFGKYSTTSQPGPHWLIPWPIQHLERVNIDQNRTSEMQGQTILTSDENIVEISVAIQYNVKNAEDFLFKVRDPDTTLQEVAESAVREVIGKNNMDFIITQGREAIASDTKVNMQQLLDEYQTGILVTTVNLESAQPPEEVQAAFSDAIKAREDEQRFINEAEAYSNGIIPRARGNAIQLLEEAKAYRTRVVKAAEGETNRFLALFEEYKKAPQVTRDRLYIDAVEGVLKNTNKVLIDVEGGNNLVYLPLDKLINASGATKDENAQLNASGGAGTTGLFESSADFNDTPGVINRRSRERDQ